MIYKRFVYFLTWYKNSVNGSMSIHDIWIQWTGPCQFITSEFSERIYSVRFVKTFDWWWMIEYSWFHVCIFRYWLVSLLCLSFACAFLLYIRVIVVWTSVLSIFSSNHVFLLSSWRLLNTIIWKTFGYLERKYHFDKEVWSLSFDCIPGWLEQQVKYTAQHSIGTAIFILVIKKLYLTQVYSCNITFNTTTMINWMSLKLVPVFWKSTTWITWLMNVDVLVLWLFDVFEFVMVCTYLNVNHL